MKKPLLNRAEWVQLGVATALSLGILSSLFWMTPPNARELGYSILGSTIRVETTDGTRLAPFYTIFFTAYEANAPEEEKQAVRELLNAHVPRLHSYGDRRHYFYDEEGQIRPNLAMLNAAYGDTSWLEIDEPFYRLLDLGRTLTVFTEGQFNMFLGHVSDFWDQRLDNPSYSTRFTDMDPLFNPYERKDLETRLTYVPMTPSEVQQTLELKVENERHYARFNVFNNAPKGELLLSLGAIAKGFANDELTRLLSESGLTRGFISNGTSSITAIGPRYGNRAYEWKVTSPLPSIDFAYTLTIQDHHALSTSGAYTGIRFLAGQRDVLRHHIIDPSTGYPSRYAIELNLVSSTLSAAALDALSTAMMTMTKEEAIALRDRLSHLGYTFEVAWVEISDQDSLIVTYTHGYHALLKRSQNVRYIRLEL